MQKTCRESDDHCKLNYSSLRYKSCCSVFFIEGEIEKLDFPLTKTSVGLYIISGYAKPPDSIMYLSSLTLHSQMESKELKY